MTTPPEPFANYIMRRLGRPDWYSRFSPRRNDPARFISPAEWRDLQREYRLERRDDSRPG